MKHILFTFTFTLAGIVFGAPAWLAASGGEPPEAPPVERLWEARYNGPVSGADHARAVIGDGEGGFFVAGSSRGPGDTFDIAVLRRDADGSFSEKWPDAGWGTGVRRYRGPFQRDGHAVALALGPEGSVIVAGYAGDINHFDEYLLLKFNAAGDLCGSWTDEGGGIGVRRFDRLGGYDQARSVVTDEQGNVFVTGRSSGISVPPAILTMKYSPDGSLVWSAVYDAKAGGDEGLSLHSDGDGGVIVGGTSTRSGGKRAMLFLRYNAEGALSGTWPDAGAGQGVRVFQGESGDHTDLAGMVPLPGGGFAATGRATGLSGNDVAATVAFSGAGDLLWSAERGSSLERERRSGVDLGAASGGGVFVAAQVESRQAGTSMETLFYGPEGELSSHWPDTGEGVGVRRWQTPRGGPDRPTALAVDRQNSVYVTGRSAAGGGVHDIVVLKYRSDGELAWEDRYSGPGNDIDQPAVALLDGDDQFLVAGLSNGERGSADMAVLAYGQDLDEDEFIVWLSSLPAGGGFLSGGGIYREGEAVSVSVTPRQGHRFLGWFDPGGAEVSAERDFTFTATEGRHLIARFQEQATVWEETLPFHDAPPWRWVNWFGTFAPMAGWQEGFPHWIFHKDHRWWFISGTDASAFHAYDYGLERWFWINRTAYPWMYDYFLGSWAYYQEGSSDPRWFFNHPAGVWQDEWDYELHSPE